jgi:hypothetical protein
MSDRDRSEMRDAEYKLTQAVAFSTSLAIALNGFGKIAIEPENEIAAPQTSAWAGAAGQETPAQTSPLTSRSLSINRTVADLASDSRRHRSSKPAVA